MTDNINHPSHYTSSPSGVECIQVTEHMNFNVGNAIKYLWRAGLKAGNERHIEDLKKARWYVEREISRVEHEAREENNVQFNDRSIKAHIETYEDLQS